MKNLFIILLIVTLIQIPLSVSSQNSHLNNRVSFALGGPTGHYGVQYEHYVYLNTKNSISSGLGLGTGEQGDNFTLISVPLMFSRVVSDKQRFGVGLSYTFLPSYDERFLFLNLEYNWIFFNPKWEWTLGFTPLYELRCKIPEVWGVIKVSYLFETDLSFKNPFKPRKRYKLKTSLTLEKTSF